MMNLGKTTLLMIGAAAILGGCTNPDGSANCTLTGAAIGTAGGALVGNLVSGGRTGATVAGAAVGGIVGNAIGADLDRQRRELEQGLEGSGATIVSTGNQLVVTLPESITFDVGSAIVHADYVDEIAFVARSLRDNPGTSVQVIGHTDKTGTTEYNQRLSERRAAAVAQILLETVSRRAASGPPASDMLIRSRATIRRAGVRRTVGWRSSSRRTRLPEARRSETRGPGAVAFAQAAPACVIDRSRSPCRRACRARHRVDRCRYPRRTGRRCHRCLRPRDRARPQSCASRAG